MHIVSESDSQIKTPSEKNIAKDISPQRHRDHRATFILFAAERAAKRNYSAASPKFVITRRADWFLPAILSMEGKKNKNLCALCVSVVNNI
jgi:hypothetical protein